MVAEIFAGISGFKAMLDIAKSFKDISDSAARQNIAIELREQILSAQETQATLIEKVRTLEAEITRFETWDTERQKYQLKNVAKGATAYVLKKHAREGEPPHWICPNCYQHRKKSILQSAGPAEKSGADMRKTAWGCAECGSSIRVQFTITPEFAEDTVDGRENG